MFDRSAETDEAGGAPDEAALAAGGATTIAGQESRGDLGPGGMDPVVYHREQNVLAQTQELRLLAGQINAAHAEMVDRLVAFTLDGWWNRASGWRSLTHWLVVNCGMTQRSAAELCVVVEAAREGLMPSVMQCARDGEVSIGMAAMAARVACPENDAALATIATTATTPQAAQAFRWYRRVAPTSEPESGGGLESGGMSDDHGDDVGGNVGRRDDDRRDAEPGASPAETPDETTTAGPDAGPGAGAGADAQANGEPNAEPPPSANPGDEPDPDSGPESGPDHDPTLFPDSAGEPPQFIRPEPTGPDPTSNETTWWRTWTDHDGFWRVSGKAPIEVGALLDEAFEAARRFAQRGIDLPDPDFGESSTGPGGTNNTGSASGTNSSGGSGGSGGSGSTGATDGPGSQDSACGGIGSKASHGSGSDSRYSDPARGNERVPVPRTYEVLRHLARLVLDGTKAHRLTREGGEPFTVNVLIDIDTLVTGALHPGSVCELANGTELTPPIVRMLAESGVLQLLWHQKGVPLKLSETVRFATAEQRKLLRFQYGGCAFPGCGQTRYLHYHHVVPFPEGPTDIDNLVPLCGREHRAVHSGHLSIEQGPDGWVTFRDGDGKVIGNRLVEQLRGADARPATASPDPHRDLSGASGSPSDGHGSQRQRPPLKTLEESLRLDHLTPNSARPNGGGEHAGVEAINNWITALLWRPSAD